MYPYANKFKVSRVSEKGDVLVSVSQEIGSFDEKGEQVSASTSGIVSVIFNGDTARELGMALIGLGKEDGHACCNTEG